MIFGWCRRRPSRPGVWRWFARFPLTRRFEQNTKIARLFTKWICTENLQEFSQRLPRSRGSKSTAITLILKQITGLTAFDSIFRWIWTCSVARIKKCTLSRPIEERNPSPIRVEWPVASFPRRRRRAVTRLSFKPRHWWDSIEDDNNRTAHNTINGVCIGQNKWGQSFHGQLHRFGSQLGVAFDWIEWPRHSTQWPRVLGFSSKSCCPLAEWPRRNGWYLHSTIRAIEFEPTLDFEQLHFDWFRLFRLIVGRLDVSFSSMSSHRVSQCDENRVKIQVPSAASCPNWNQATGSCGPASIASVESSSSSSSSSSSRGVVTVLEGPQSCTTVVESLSGEPVKVRI